MLEHINKRTSLRNLLFELFEENSNVHSSLGIQDADLGEQRDGKVIHLDERMHNGHLNKTLAPQMSGL